MLRSDLNTHMHMDNMPQQPAYVVEQAKTLDRKAAESGVDAIAPLSVSPFLDRPGAVALTFLDCVTQVRSAGAGEGHDGDD